MTVDILTDLTTVLHWLETPKNSQPRQGLERLRHALNYLGNPQAELSVIHLTGTNGKGTVSAFLKALLMSQQLKVGAFTSPHIMQFNERIAVDDTPISDMDLMCLTNEMVALNNYMQTTEYGQLTGFELYTAMACVYFARKNCDVCLIEVGIGGREDCTNVLEGQIAVITTIGLDHVDKLGHTLSEIAYQKAGIIKPNALVVTGAIEADILSVIRQEAGQQSAQLEACGHDFAVSNVQLSANGAQFLYNNRLFRTRMLGQHQVDNAMVALRTFEAWMQRIGCNIDWESATNALQAAHWPARMEKMYNKPLIYLDGAHNPAGIQALRRMLQSLFVNYEITLLYSGLSTKDQYQQLIDLDTFGARQLVITEFDHLHAMSLPDFEQLMANVYDYQTDWRLVRDWSSFVTQYIQREQSNDKALLVVTGSLYFVSTVRQFFVKEKIV